MTSYYTEDELHRKRANMRLLRENPEYRAAEKAQQKVYKATPEGREKVRKAGRDYYARRRGRALVKAPFVGVDGEGGDDTQKRHHYYLLRAGDECLESKKPLSWETCFGFLAGLDPTNLYVAYFFDYDVTMMCKDLPPYKIRRLLDRQSRFRDGYYTPLPVDVGDFEVDYIKGKCFKVRCRTPPDHRNLPWVEVSDVGRFFAQPFVKTIEEWDVGTPKQRAAVAEGKESRANFGGLTGEIRRYNATEVKLLEELMEKFRTTCEKVGRVVPAKWQGPGDLASALLKNHDIPKKTALPIWDDKLLLDAANHSYYGGRFETSAVGTVPDPVYNADLNSAYPYTLTHVPCLQHGVWEKSSKPKSPLYLARGSFQAVESAGFYGLPVRNRRGGVSFPAENGVGVYWSFEILASRHQTFDADVCWSYRRECECELFAWIEGLYLARLEMKKDARGKVLKLALNSLYGKMAQRVGSAPYNNYVWSSYITAYTRTLLQNYIHSLPACGDPQRTCGDDVLMLATDGVYSTELPADFTPSDKLGGWDLKTYPEGVFIVQPGLYFDNRGDAEHRLAKTRGLPVNKAVEHETQLRTAFGEVYRTGDPTAVTVPIPLVNFTGLRQASHRRQLHTAGQWLEETRHVSFDWRTKRQAEARRRPGHLRTLPPVGDAFCVSHPYDPALAGSLDERRIDAGMDFSEQPDFRTQILGNVETD